MIAVHAADAARLVIHLAVTVPDSPAVAPPAQLVTDIETIIGWAKWGVLACGVIGLLICSGMMILGRRSRSQFSADGAAGIPWVLGGLALAATAAGIVGVFA